MTPLAQQFFRQMNTAPAQLRDDLDPGGVAGMREDLHCFECTPIEPTIRAAMTHADNGDHVSLLNAAHDVGRRVFLPSPRTWLEWFDREHGRRTAVLCELREDDGLMLWRIGSGPEIAPWILATPAGVVTVDVEGMWGIGLPEDCYDTPAEKVEEESRLAWLAVETYLTLDLINTPGAVRLRKRDPHVGFAREMRRKFPGYQLQAWHEVRPA